MRTIFTPALILAAASAACTTSDRTDDGAPPARTVDATGSYDMVFPDANAPEGSRTIRLYLIRSGPDTHEARLGTELGDVCDVRTTTDSVTLDDCTVAISLNTPGKFEPWHQDWSQFVLERTADGALSGHVASDVVERSVGSERNQRQVRGMLERSTHEPELVASVLSSYRSRPALPWDRFRVGFGANDALRREGLDQSLRLSTEAGGELPVTWHFSPPADDPPDVGVMDAEASFAWRDAIGSRLIFTLAEGVRNFADRAAPALRAEVTLLDLGPTAAVHDFDGAAIAEANWGTVALDSATPLCPDSCVRLGPPVTSCQGPGLAGVLDTRAADKVIVRLRVVSEHASLLNTHVRLVHEVVVAETEVNWSPSSAELREDLGDASDSMRFASEFRELELPLTQDLRQERLGFEISFDNQCPFHTSPSTSLASLLIDRIAAE